MYNAAVLLDAANKSESIELEINWRSFSLAQNSSTEGPDWKAWEQPDESEVRGILALRGGEAARRQGPEAFGQYHMALLEARHADRRDIGKRDVLVEIATEVGLDIAQFAEDLEDRSLIESIARDHLEAAEQHGVFGTPTFLFGNGRSAFLKILRTPPEEAPKLTKLLFELMENWSYVGEIKRPQPPWPRGAYDSQSGS